MKAIGIDLGTTNSCVAVWRHGRADVLPNLEGQTITPSMVAEQETGELWIGEPAKVRAELNPQYTYRAVKRLIGRGYDDPLVETLRAVAAFGVEEADNGEAWIRGRERLRPPQEISGLVLRRLKESAERALGGGAVTQAVITVPAYFNNAQREATREAARIAGLEVLRIINEPTAAALAELGERGRTRTIAVYDLGGGTFDCSILRGDGDDFEVLASNGDTFLGGEDFDTRIVNHLAEAFLAQHGVDPRKQRIPLQRLRNAAEAAKIALSGHEHWEIAIGFFYQDGPDSPPLHLKADLSRQTLELLTADLIERTLDCCRLAMADAGLQPGDIDELLLVGGMTRMPAVHVAAQAYFRAETTLAPDPDLIVARGAAKMAAALAGGLDFKFADVTPFDIAIDLADGGRAVLIPAQSRIPALATRPATTARDDQGAVTIRLRQGNEEDRTRNRPLAQFHLGGLRPGPRGEAMIDITADVDADGVVTANARDRSTGRSNWTTATEAGLSPRSVDRMAQGARRAGAAS